LDSVSTNPVHGVVNDFSGWSLNDKNGRRKKFRKQLGVLPFTRGDAIELEGKRKYHTLGGPTFYSKSSVVYGESVVNLGKAVNRLDAARPNEEELRKANQNIAPLKGRRLRRYLDSYYRKIKSGLYPGLMSLRDFLTEVIYNALDPTHPKYYLRLRSCRELLCNVNVMESLFTLEVTVKLKIPETAKAGKDGRVIGDFSCPGSLLAPFLVSHLKEAFSERIEHDGCVIRFCKSTDVKVLEEMMQEMLDSTCNYFIFYSDDMCCKLITPDGEKLFNLDISACDRSNTLPVFERLRWFYEGTGWDDLIDRACKQCELPVYIKNPEVKGEWITANTDLPREFSGTILTTVLNNIAASAICLSINRSLQTGDWHGSNGHNISKCAAAVGYIVTAQDCESEADIQFLKNSFWRDDDGKVHSFLNVGAQIRNFGSCWMDYPYSKRDESLESVVRFRNWAVLKGYVNSGDNALLRALRESPGCNLVGRKSPSNKTQTTILNHVDNENRHKSASLPGCRIPVPDWAILKRYKLTVQEWDELCSFTRKSDVGYIICCTAVAKVLHCDYGYSLD